MKTPLFHNQNGFSLVELMVVISIASLIVAFSIPNFMMLRIKAARSEMNLNMNVISTALHSYNAENGNYPIGHQIAGYQYFLWSGGQICASPQLGLKFDNCSKLHYYYSFTSASSSQFVISAMNLLSITGGMKVQYGATIPTNMCKRPVGHTSYYHDSWSVNEIGASIGTPTDAMKVCF